MNLYLIYMKNQFKEIKNNLNKEEYLINEVDNDFYEIKGKFNFNADGFIDFNEDLFLLYNSYSIKFFSKDNYEIKFEIKENRLIYI